MGPQIATIQGAAITVELENITQQTNRLYARKFLSHFDFERGFGTSPKDKNLSDFLISEQDTIIRSLADGTRKMELIIEGSTGTHEKVTGLKIYYPT